MNQDRNKIIRYIREHVDILEVAQRYLDLKKVGSNYRCHSPFVNERTPSFFVSPAKKIFKCFSTGIGGDVVKLVAELEKITIDEAIKKIIQDYNLNISYDTFIDKQFEQYKNAFRDAIMYYHNNKKQVLEYLRQRGLDNSFYNNYLLGYADNKHEHFFYYMTKEKGYDPEYLAEIGIFIKKSDKFYPYQTDAYVIPLTNNGNVIGIQYRTIKNNYSKYIFTRNNKYFVKSRYLFNADRIDSNPSYIMITEGVFDVFSAIQTGYKNVIAVLGINDLMNHYDFYHKTKNIVLAIDNDKTGIEHIKKFISHYKNQFDIFIVDFQDAKDYNEYIVKYKSKPNIRNWVEHFKVLSERVKNDLEVKIILDFIEENLTKSNLKNSFYINTVAKHGYDLQYFKEEMFNNIFFIAFMLIMKAIETGNYDAYKKIKTFFLIRNFDEEAVLENTMKNIIIKNDTFNIDKFIEKLLNITNDENIIDFFEKTVILYEEYKNSIACNYDNIKKLYDLDCEQRINKLNNIFLIQDKNT